MDSLSMLILNVLRSWKGKVYDKREAIKGVHILYHITISGPAG
jgi:hypothetical protein